MEASLILTSVVVFLASAVAWQNEYDQPLHFECEPSEQISEVRSVHSNHYEDRQWLFTCRAIPSGAKLAQCKWYNDVNEMDELLAFRCPGSQVITGVNSRHDNHFEDRVFGFRCCALIEKKLDRCLVTSFVNQYDGPMNYLVPIDYAIIGFDSEHNNHFEDRRWKIEICEVN